MLLVLPYASGVFYTRLIIEAFSFGLLAMSVAILMGKAGLLSVGQAAYFGMSAYATGLLLRAGVTSFPVVLILATGATAAMGTLIGMISVRTSGVYFALITFATSETFLKIVGNTRSLGGSDGLSRFPVPTLPGVGSLTGTFTLYYLALFLLVITYIATKRLLSSPFGSVLDGIRENAQRVRFVGYEPYWYKVAAFALSAAVAGVGGVLYVTLRGFVAPELFSFQLSAKALVMAMVGGIGTLAGPLIGGVAVTLADSIVSALTDRHLFFLGLLFVAFVLYCPDGIASQMRRMTKGAAGEIA